MANNCFYMMKIRGTHENCKKWIQKMRSYDEPNHFWRMFTVDVDEENGPENNYSMMISGDCAWSLESCCRSSGYSGGVDLFAENTRELDIVMEAYSEEPGFEFQEHYIYEKGQCVTDKCEDWVEFCWDKDEYPSFVDYKKECGLPENILEDDFDSEGYARCGGFHEWKFSI